MKREWKKFGFKVAAWVVAALAVQFLTTIFLGAPPEYVVPGILALGALQIGALDRTPLPVGDGRLLKRGIAMIMLAFAGWLAIGDAPESRIAWQLYSDELLQAAQRGGRTVMVEFTSRNCQPCLDMERSVFSSRRVAQAAKEFLAVRVDCTGADTKVQALEDKFGVRGYPTIVFLGSNGVERSDLRLVGFESAAFFTERLERAR